MQHAAAAVACHHFEPVGAEVGEQDVAARLEPLTRTAWRVLNSVQVTEYGGDIDHVLVGPPGVFTINTKHHAGQRVDVKADTIWVGRYPKDYAHQAKEEAHTATNRLRFASGLHVTVLPVIVILVGPDGRLRIKSRPPGVTVLAGEDVPAYFAQLHPIYSAAEVELLHECLRYARLYIDDDLWHYSLPWLRASSIGSTPKTIELAIAAGVVSSAAAAAAAVRALSGSSLMVSAQPRPVRAARTRRTEGWSMAVGMRRSVPAGIPKYVESLPLRH